MSKGDILQSYTLWADEDRPTFDRWLKANAVIASLFAAALVGMAFGGSYAPGPAQAIAQDAQATEIGSSARQGEQKETVSPYELTVRIAPEQLPVQQVDEPF